MSLICAADLQEEPIQWLWEPRFPRKMVSLIAGDPEHGKGLLLCKMTAHITTGTPWPDGSPCTEGEVIFATTEDDKASVIKPRLKAAGANMKYVYFPAAQHVTGILQEAQAAHLQPAMFILDPIQGYLAIRNFWKDSDVREGLKPMQNAAQELNAAGVGVKHLTKAEDRRLITKMQDSIAFAALSRASWIVSCLRQTPTSKEMVLSRLKANLAPPMTKALRYDLLGWPPDPRIGWLKWIGLIDDDPDFHSSPSLRAACHLLRGLLGAGPLASQLLAETLTKAGLASKQYAALHVIGAKPHRIGFGPQSYVQWELPGWEYYTTKVVDNPSG